MMRVHSGSNGSATCQGALHVMHVVHALQPGGMELGVVKLVNGLDRERIRSSILSTRPATELKHQLLPDVGLYELARRPGNDLRLVWQMYRLFREVHPDVVHTHAWGTLIEGLVAARLARVPIVVHGEHGTLQLRGYQRAVQRRAWSAADKVLAVSARLAERMSIETGFPLPKIHTIQNGVDLSRFGRMRRSAARAALGLQANELVIGTMGRLVPVKDQGSFMEAVRQLRDNGLSCTAIVAGDGPLLEDLQKQVDTYGLAGKVRFLGHRPDPEVVMAALDVYVLSSISEGMPNTVLEAMATGLPVVATHVGGADELVLHGVTGFLVRPEDPLALAESLARLLRDETLRLTAGTAARVRAETEFALSGMIRRYEALYGSMFQGPGKRKAQTGWRRTTDTAGM